MYNLTKGLYTMVLVVQTTVKKIAVKCVQIIAVPYLYNIEYKCNHKVLTLILGWLQRTFHNVLEQKKLMKR